MLIHGDCLAEMDKLIRGRAEVSLVLTDPPYGTTNCKWDSIIPFDAMWERLKRLAPSRIPILLFGAEPFSSALRMSNVTWYKYDWIWHKDKSTGFLNAKKQPLRWVEMISVFYNGQPQYYPQYQPKKLINIRPATVKRHQVETYNKMDGSSKREIPTDMGYPGETLMFNGCSSVKGQSNHPTEKPVALLEYLIRTYTKENQLVLDFTMGSGSTGVACANMNRRFVGIEKDEEYFNVARSRIELAEKQQKLFV